MSVKEQKLYEAIKNALNGLQVNNIEIIDVIVIDWNSMSHEPNDADESCMEEWTKVTINCSVKGRKDDDGTDCAYTEKSYRIPHAVVNVNYNSSNRTFSASVDVNTIRLQEQ